MIPPKNRIQKDRASQNKNMTLETKWVQLEALWAYIRQFGCINTT